MRHCPKSGSAACFKVDGITGPRPLQACVESKPKTTLTAILHRLALAGVLVVTVGLVHSLDVAVLVASSLTVMEIDADVT